MLRLVAVVVVAGSHPFLLAAQGPNQAPFANAVAAYVEIHRAAAVGVSSSGADIPERTHMIEVGLAQRIQARRQTARPGDVLGPASESIRSIVRDAMTGGGGNAMLSSIQQTNVQGARLRVNHRYPPGLPRVTMPGPLLASLPPIPPELEYRFLGRSLLLIDTRANLVVDLLPDVLPAGPR